MEFPLEHTPDLNLKNTPLALQLLLNCLRVSEDQKAEPRIRALTRQDVDWDFFVNLVDRHRVVSPVYENLKRFAGNNLPEPVQLSLRERYQRNVQHVLAKTAELIRIVKRFEQYGISVLPLKGPVVSMQAYGDLGSRHVGDLDILVSSEQTLEAENILLRDGYRRTHPDFELTPKQKLFYIRYNHHFGYFCRKRNIRVELHWRFGSNRHLFPFKFSEFWRTKERLQFGGTDVPTLSMEHTILLLCVHGSNHIWRRLFWLNDVGHLITKTDALDWRKLMRRAEKSGISRMVAEGVFLAGALLGSPLPEPVHSYMRQDSGVSRIAEKTFYLLRHSAGPNHKPFTYPYYCAKFHGNMLRSDMGYKLAFFVSHLGADYGDWGRVPLPDTLFPLYFVLRPVSWFFRYFVPKTKIYREGPMGQG